MSSCTKARLKVTLLTGPLSEQWGGLYRAIVDLATNLLHLEASTIEVKIKCLTDSGDRRPQIEGISVESFEPIRWTHRFGVSWQLWRSLASETTDVIHVHGLWTFPSFACSRIHKTYGLPYVVSPHGMLDPWALRQSRLKKLVASALYQRDSLNRATWVHALNEAEKRSIRDFGVRAPVFVQPNGVTALPESSIMRLAANRNQRITRTVLFLGRFHEKKGLAELIDAWRIARTSGLTEGWRLRICGWSTNRYRAELLALVAAFELTDSVSIEEGVNSDGKRDLLENAHVFVLPSHSEGLPIAVLEAWAYGLPVVMTPACNLPEGYAERAALECSPHPESIAHALVAISNVADDERAEMGRRGHALVRRSYNPSRIAHAFADAYRWAIECSDTPVSMDLL